MGRGYYSLDRCLMEDERFPCVFRTTVFKMGEILDASLGREDVLEDDKIELPLWLAEVLAYKKVVTVQQPKCYSSRVRDAVGAGAGSINLRDQNQYWYLFGAVVAKLGADSQLSEILLDAFTSERFQRVLDLSLNCRDEDVASFTRTLPFAERRLFEAGQLCSKEYCEWKHGGRGVLKASQLALESAKRQRTGV